MIELYLGYDIQIYMRSYIGYDVEPHINNAI